MEGRAADLVQERARQNGIIRLALDQEDPDAFTHGVQG
jgi:hypothetical protein